MGWFTRKADPMNARSRELNDEIAALEAQIEKLQDATGSTDHHEIQTALENTPDLPPDPVLLPATEFPEAIPAPAAELERDCPGLYNDLGVRKFDLYGWWQRLKGHETVPVTTSSEKIVTYLAAGRSHGYTALRKERRVARNRFIILTLVLLAVLWSILSLLIPQL